MPSNSPARSAFIVVRWNDYTVAHRRVASGQRFRLGADGDVEMPREFIGAPSWDAVLVDGDGVLVRVPPAARAIEAGHGALRAIDGVLEVRLPEAGGTCALDCGSFSVRVRAEGAQRAARPALAWGTLGWFAAAAVVVGAPLTVASHLPGPSRAEVDAEREHLMRVYLAASDARSMTTEAHRATDSLEGGMGTRAAASSRYAVHGPSDSERRVARAHALREAAEFGMIGLLAEGAPNARGNAWGAEVGDAFGAGGLGLARGGDAEGYLDHGVSSPVDPRRDRLSTFAVDVDTGSYTLMKRKLFDHALPRPEAVRVEELVNAFEYGYPAPDAGSDAPFAVRLDAAPSPFDAARHVLRVAIQGRRVAREARPVVHLTYLVDTSGSMQSDDKIGLVKESLALLTRSLRPTDTVALCTYAGSVRLVLPPTPAREVRTVLGAIDDLVAQGSTAMQSGLELAYSLASRSHRQGEISRVVVLSDGDANVGATSPAEILATIDVQRRRGIRLSTIGFGQGNYKDSVMEPLADAGDGNYSYVGSLRDARRVFVEQVEGLLHVIARDAKVQVDMDPSVVAEYRLIGYENRDVADEDFRNDDVDGGEIGAGHAVTALYDVVLRSTTASPVTVRLRYQEPDGPGSAREVAVAMDPSAIRGSFADADSDFRFAVGVAGLGEVLRGSPHAAEWDLAAIAALARSAAAHREEREEFVTLVERAATLRRAVAVATR